MTMKRFCATALLLLWSLCALAVQKSGTIVYINGSKFYVHTVQPASATRKNKPGRNFKTCWKPGAIPMRTITFP